MQGGDQPNDDERMRRLRILQKKKELELELANIELEQLERGGQDCASNASGAAKENVFFFCAR